MPQHTLESSQEAFTPGSAKEVSEEVEIKDFIFAVPSYIDLYLLSTQISGGRKK